MSTTIPPPSPDSPAEIQRHALEAVNPLRSTVPGWGAPSHQQPSNDPLDEEATTVTPGRAPGGDDGGDPGPPPPRSSTPPIGPSQVFSPDNEAFAGVIGVAVGLGSMGLSWRLSPNTGAYVATEDEQAAIAAPLARIAARHVKVASNETASDLGDGLEAALGILCYGIAAQTRAVEIKRQATVAGFTDLEQP